MIASNEVHLLREECFECKKKADGLEAVTSSIDEVSEEQVVKVFNVLLPSIFEGRAIECEEAHEIRILSVDVTEDLQRSPHCIINANYLGERWVAP